jgi:hypothetical protein
LASTCGEAEGFTRWVTLLDCELTDACQARDMAKASFWGFSSVVGDADWWCEEAERECQELVQELTLLNQGIYAMPSHSRSFEGGGSTIKGMQIAAILHNEMAEQLAMLWAVVSSHGPCSCARLLKPSGWTLWMSCSLSFGSRRSGALASRSPVRGSIT